MTDQNPKLVDTNTIDCIPQTGLCPNKGCSTECFYNEGFYRTLGEPLLPTAEEAKGKLVRVNCGHDSNLHKDTVLKLTEHYKEKFYNTSLPNTDFPAPVVFTANGRDTDLSAYFLPEEQLNNIMYVRFRTNTWNTNLCWYIVDYYTDYGIPVMLTFMRYGTKQPKMNDNYIKKKSINNVYYMIKPEAWRTLEETFEFNDLVYSCGSPESSYCRDCGNCEKLYTETKERNII